MATTIPLEDVKTVVTRKDVVKILTLPAVVVTAVTATSPTVSELLGALVEAASILAIRYLIVIMTIAPLTSLKTWC